MADNMEQKVTAVSQTPRIKGKTSGNGKERDKHAVITANDNTGLRTEEETAVYSDFGKFTIMELSTIVKLQTNTVICYEIKF